MYFAILFKKCVDLLQFIEPVRALQTGDLLELQRRREEIASRTSALLTDSVDVLLTPTMPCMPPRTDAPSAAAVDWFEWCPFTPLFNLSHGPAISVPWHGKAGSLPVLPGLGGRSCPNPSVRCGQ